MFDPVAYQKELESAIDGLGVGARYPAMGAPGIGGGTRSPTGMMDDPASGGITGGMFGGGPSIDGEEVGGAQPQNLPGQRGGGGGKKIQIGPPGFRPKFDEEKISQAKTIKDVIDAMPPKDQTTYMDWWEKQHGAINAKWNAIESELGQRPKKGGKLSRKDKFGLLMEFGLNLIKNSQSNGRTSQTLGGAASGAIHDTIRGSQARQEYDEALYDQQLGGARAGRAKELEGIGNYGDALKGQSQIDEDTRQGAEADTRRIREENEVDLLQSDQGTYSRRRIDGKTEPVLGIDGKPLTNFKVGQRGGVERDNRASEEKKFDHLTKLGLGKEAAMRIAYRQMSGDPRKDYQMVFRDALKSNFGDEKKAKQIADSYIEFVYPGESLQQRSAPLVPEDNDPLGIRKPPPL
jgi:hypothetical protein